MESVPSRLPYVKDPFPTAPIGWSREPRLDATGAVRVERILGIVRAGLATLGLLALSASQAELTEARQLLGSLMLAYCLGAIALIAYLYRAVTVPRHMPLVLQTVDVAVAGGVTLFLDDGLHSPMFVFLIYPILAGAYRWSVQGALLAAAVLEAMFLSYGLLGAAASPFGAPTLESNTLLLRVASIPIIGCLAGYLAYMERQRRREAIDLSTVLRSARSTGEFDQTVALVFGSLLEMFSAATIMLVITDRKTGGTFLWRAAAREHAAPVNEHTELPPDQLKDYLFDLAGGAGCQVKSPQAGWSFDRAGRVFDESGRRIPGRRPGVPPGFVRRHPFHRITCVALDSGASAGRLFVLDPGRRMTWRNTARLALRICRELAPDIHGLYRIHHLRTRAQAVERGRIARELHDSVTQLLLGAEMLIAVLRRRTMEIAPALGSDLLQIHDVVRQSIVALREVSEGGHVMEAASGDPLKDLEDIVDRFRRHTGIEATFSSDGQRVASTLYLQSELARLVHEGLVNVRKHSGAHRVIVRSVVANGCWLVSLEDDGHGFPFGGRKTQAELDEHREGPRTILERARRIGAEVVVESRPGSGARIEMAIRLVPEP